MIPLFEGVKLGLIISLVIGPVFLLIVSESVVKGKKHGLLLASGVWTVDISMAMIFYFGLSKWLNFSSYGWFMTMFGFLFLLTFGIMNIFASSRGYDLSNADKIVKQNKQSSYLKGFGTALLSPSAPLFWMSIIGLLTGKGYHQSQGLLYLAGFLGTMIFADVTKVFLSGSAKDYLTHRHIRIFKKMVGIVLVIFAFVLLYKGLKQVS